LAAAPVMHELAGRINQSCHLVVRSGNQGLVVLRQENPMRHANLSVRMGATLNLVTSCSGNLLLAGLEAGERDRLLDSLPKPRDVPRTKLLKVLEKIGKHGFEIRPSPITAGVTDIGYPVRGLRRQGGRGAHRPLPACARQVAAHDGRADAAPRRGRRAPHFARTRLDALSAQKLNVALSATVRGRE
jgi:hypothetical protein